MRLHNLSTGVMLLPIKPNNTNDESCEVEGISLINEKFIIALINEESNRIYLINAEGKPRKPICLAIDDVTEHIKNKRIKASTVTYSYYSMLEDEKINPKWIKKRDYRLQIINEIIDNDYSLENFLNASAQNPVVKKIASIKGCTRDSVYKFAYIYLQGGRRRNALLPNYDRIGKSSSNKTKVGANTDGKRIGVAINENSVHYENIKKSLEKYYKNKHKNTYQYAYDKMCDDDYSFQVWNKDNEKYEIEHFDDNDKPTIDQFKYWAKKYLDPVKTSKARKGRSQHEKDFRPLISTSDYDVRGPGEKYEIDATIGDIYLVSGFDRSRTTSIGRPVIYLVTDVYSRCIVGLYVGLEGPSWNGARAALYNTFRNKVDFCAEFGIEISEEDWPCHHVCNEIFADRGELIGKNAESLLDNIGVKAMGFAGPYRGDLKGLVEQHFNVLNKRTLELLPGNSVKVKRKRGERKPENDGLLTIHELTQIIINDIIDYNKYQTKKVVGNIEMIKDQIIPTPINLWNWGMEFGIGCVNTIDDNSLYLGLLPSAQATVKGDGVYFEGLRYSSEIAIKNGWLSKSRMRGKYSKIDIKYTKATTNFIWIINPEDKSLEFCPLNDVMEKFKNLRLDEYLDQVERSSKAIRQAKKTRKRHEAKTRQTNEEIVRKAREDKGKTSHKPKDVRENRSIEKEHHRKADAEKAIVASNETSSENSSGDEADENISSINKKALDILDELF